MILYHGSNIAVREPRILESLRALDFGAGFYLTSSREQAEKWARIVVKRQKTGTPTVSVFEFSEKYSESLRVREFSSADSVWLDFVVSNRKQRVLPESYDLVIVPVANDSTLRVIDDFIDGVYTKEEAVRRLLPQNLADQFSFLTPNALAFLTFKESRTLWNA